MRSLLLAVAALFSLATANASLLQFSALTAAGDVVSFTLNTSVANTYNPTDYPGPIRGVYLGAVYNLSYDATMIPVSDVTTTPGETGAGTPLTIMDVGPLFDSTSLSLELIFFDPGLVTPLDPDPSSYEQTFSTSPASVLFPQTPPPRTNVDPLLTLTVTEVPEPSSAFAAAVGALFAIALRTRWMRGGNLRWPHKNTC